jgi:hypothetical protein
MCQQVRPVDKLLKIKQYFVFRVGPLNIGPSLSGVRTCPDCHTVTNFDRSMPCIRNCPIVVQMHLDSSE